MKLQITNKQNIFFCSDPHYNHAGIVWGTSKWADTESNCRMFDTLEMHDQTLVENINNTVGEDDILFCLGDWSFGDYKNGENISNIRKFREQIKCKTVHLIFGNHDEEIRKDKDNSKSLFSSVNDYLEIVVIEQPVGQGVKAIKQQISLSHYSFRTWNKSAHGSWMLYGHSHNNLPDIGGKTMDVGFDTHPEFRPYSFQELRSIMDKREVKDGEDHHQHGR